MVTALLLSNICIIQAVGGPVIGLAPLYSLTKPQKALILLMNGALDNLIYLLSDSFPDQT